MTQPDSPWVLRSRSLRSLDAPAGNEAQGGEMSKQTSKLRHGARNGDQEYERDVEMREAVKAAEKEARRVWHDNMPPLPSSLMERRQIIDAYVRARGSADDLQWAARAAARKTLRERWAQEDAEFAKPLKPNLTRMTSADLREIKSESLEVARRTYITEVCKLNKGARHNEAKRLRQALEQVERDVKERDVNEQAKNRTTPYAWES